jgi:hypothetical protein
MNLVCKSKATAQNRSLLIGKTKFSHNKNFDYYFKVTSVPTLIEQIQLVRRFLREVLKGSVLKQA